MVHEMSISSPNDHSFLFILPFPTTTTEFAKKLQALARHEDKQLLRVFEASFEGEGLRKEEDFDLEFFLEEGRGVVREMEEASAAKGSGVNGSSSSSGGKEA